MSAGTKQVDATDQVPSKMRCNVLMFVLTLISLDSAYVDSHSLPKTFLLANCGSIGTATCETGWFDAK